MKIAIAQLNFHIGNFAGNTQKMLDAVAVAKKQDADLICFSELATCGYPPRDFLEFDDFIRLAEEAIAKLAEAARGIAIVVGSPSRNPVVEGKDLFNSAYFLEDGKVKHKANKALLPTYDIFDENPLYTICPMDELIKQKPDFMLNLSASPFHFEQATTRINIVRANVKRYGIPMYICYLTNCNRI